MSNRLIISNTVKALIFLIKACQQLIVHSIADDDRALDLDLCFVYAIPYLKQTSGKSNFHPTCTRILTSDLYYSHE